LPVHAVAKISQIRKTARALTEKLGHEVTDEELAAELRMPLEKLIHLRSVAVHPASLDAPLGESADASLLGDIVRDEGASSPSEALGSKNVSSDLARAVNSLGEREAMIIRMRFGLDGNDEMTLEEIGKKFNVTRERIRQLEQLSIKHMRRLMENRDNQRSSEEIVEDSIEKGRMEVVKQFVQSRNLLAITDSKSDKIMGRS
jgi:RNA polymerase primary sigma factor